MEQVHHGEDEETEMIELPDRGFPPFQLRSICHGMIFDTAAGLLVIGDLEG